jgi:hypothetical protein
VSAFAATTIVAERLLLVPLRPEDADEMVDVLADPRLHQFIGGHPATLEELRARYATLTAGSPGNTRDTPPRRRGRWSAGLTADTCTTSSPTSTPIMSRRQRWPCEPAEVALQEELMRLEPLYRIRFTYPENWAVGLDGGWQQRTGPARPRVGLAAAGVGGHRQGGPADRGGRGGRRGVGGLDGLDDGRVPPLPTWWVKATDTPVNPAATSPASYWLLDSARRCSRPRPLERRPRGGRLPSYRRLPSGAPR